MKSLLAILCLFLMTNAEAYIFAKVGNGAYDRTKKTHIVVAGEGDEAETLFQQAAITKAFKYQEIYPQDQVVLLLQPEGKLKENLASLEERKLQIIKSTKAALQSMHFIQIASEIRSIGSLDIYSHSGVNYGAKLSDFSRINTGDKFILALKPNFTADAYMVIHGCNSGFDEAPGFSELFDIPVFGSLTSTDFQEKLSDGNWYFNNKEDKPAGLTVDSKCGNGKCIRLKPRNGSYTGYWGSYSGGGLPFYKVFCKNMEKEKCLSALAKNVLVFVSSSSLTKKPTLDQYKAVVQDMLCPISPTKNLRADCVEKLNQISASAEVAKALKTYSPYNSKLLQCDLDGCQHKFECNRSGICDLVNTAKETPDTFVSEYLSYMEAYKTL